MSTDLETLLRSTLAGRAETVTSGPAWAGPDTLASRPGPNRNRHWLAVAAAACAVLAVGAGAVALQAMHGRSTPASPSPSVSVPTPVQPTTGAPTTAPTTHSTTPPPAPTVTELASCAATLPQQWTDALQHSVVGVGGRTASALAAAPDGSLVVLRDDGVTPGSGREVDYVAPGGASSAVYTIKDPDHVSVQTAAVSGPWLVLGLWNDPRPAKNTVPGSSSVGLQGIVVVNLENLTSTLITGTDTALPPAYGGPSTQSFAVSGATVFWDVEQHYGDATGVLKAYDLGSGTTRTVTTGPAGYVVANAAGVGWTRQGAGPFVFAVRNTLPAVVEKAMTDFTRPRLRTDGSAYAWIGSARDVYWWKPGLARPVHLTLPKNAAIDTEDGGGYVSVAGNVLVSDTRTPMVIDMRTGAVAPFPTTGLFGSERGEFVGNTGAVFYGLAFTGTAGQFENGYWADTATSPLRVDVSKLPDVTC